MEPRAGKIRDLMTKRGLAVARPEDDLGLVAQIMVWALVNRPFWTYGGGKSVPLLKYWGFDGMILMVIAVVLSLVWFNRKHHR